MDTPAAAEATSGAPASPAAYSLAGGIVAAVVGAVLFSLVFWATSETGPIPINWPEWTSTPVHLTALFALPLCLFWMGNGRMKPAGLLVIVVGMTAVHWLAMYEAIQIATANTSDAGHNSGLLAGAAGGAIGAVGTWLVLMLMSGDFRTPKAIALMLVSAVLLALIGAYGIGVGSLTSLVALVTGAQFQSPELDPPSLTMSLYLPWQLVYGVTLVKLFKAHRA